MLVLTRKKGESILILDKRLPGPIKVTLVTAGDGRASLGFSADRETIIDREELYTDGTKKFYQFKS